jgi:tetratricopeptide (TPR) repeat protein
MWPNSDEYIRKVGVLPSVRKYEEMLKHKTIVFFDVSDFEEIIDFYINQNNTIKAWKAINYATSQFPAAESIFIRKAQLLIDSDNAEKSINVLDTILAINKYNLEAIILKGIAFLKLGTINKAIGQFEKTIKYAKKDSKVYHSIGLIFCNAGSFELAHHYFKKACLLSQTQDEILFFDYASCLIRLDKYKESIFFLQKALKINSYNEQAWLLKAEIESKLEMYPEAIESYGYALSINENLRSPYFGIADSYYNLCEYGKAISTYFDFLKIYLDDANALYCIGECFEKLEKYNDALFYFKKAIEQDEFHADAHFGIGLILKAQGFLTESLVSTETAIGLNWTDPEYWHIYGKINLELGNISDAHSAFQTMYELSPKDENFTMTYLRFMATLTVSSEVKDTVGQIAKEFKHSARVNQFLSTNFDLSDIQVTQSRRNFRMYVNYLIPVKFAYEPEKSNWMQKAARKINFMFYEN